MHGQKHRCVCKYFNTIYRWLNEKQHPRHLSFNATRCIHQIIKYSTIHNSPAVNVPSLMLLLLLFSLSVGGELNIRAYGAKFIAIINVLLYAYFWNWAIHIARTRPVMPHFARHVTASRYLFAYRRYPCIVFPPVESALFIINLVICLWISLY